MSLNAAAIEILIGKGLTAADMLDVARALEANGGPRSAAAARQARYRQRKAEGVTNDVTRDVTPPPKKDIQTPSSEPSGSGGEAADPIKQLFDVGVSLLTSSGQSEKQARSLIGKWRKAKTDGEVLTAILDCRGRAISNPVEWLERRLKSAKWVSASGYEYRGSDQDVLREAEKRNDMDTYWRVKAAISGDRQAA